MGERIVYYYSSVSSNLEVSLAFKCFFDAKVVGVVWAQGKKCIFPTANSVLFGGLAVENRQGRGILQIAKRISSVT